MTSTDLTSHRLLITVLTGIGVALGVVVAVLTTDVILGVVAGAGFIAIATGIRGHPNLSPWAIAGGAAMTFGPALAVHGPWLYRANSSKR